MNSVSAITDFIVALKSKPILAKQDEQGILQKLTEIDDGVVTILIVLFNHFKFFITHTRLIKF